MKFSNFLAKDAREVKDILLQCKPSSPDLILFFCACCQEEIEKVVDVAAAVLPDVERVGVSAASVIKDGEVFDSGIVVCCVKGNVKVVSSDFVDELERGRFLGKSLAGSDDGFIVLLSDGTETKGESLIEGLREYLRIPLVGGKASNSDFGDVTLVFHNEKLMDRGAIAVYFEEKSFVSDYVFDWVEVGRRFLVTKADGNRVYTINHFPAVEFYRHYLGDVVANGLPGSGIEYPLVFEVNGRKVARTCVKKLEDGSLLFAGEVPSGVYVRLGCGSLRDGCRTLSRLKSVFADCESHLVFSCFARRKFLGEEVEKELQVLGGRGGGFFTFGEYYDDCVLNESLVVLGTGVEGKRLSKVEEKCTNKESSLYAISHFLNQTTKEYELITEAVDNNDFGVMVLLPIGGSRKCIFASKSLEKITGYRVEDFILGRVSFETLIHKGDLHRVLRIRQSFLKEGKREGKAEYRIVTADGKVKWVRSFIRICEDGKIVFSIIDITPEKAVEFLAVKDPLTGLYNRQFAFEILSKLIAHNKRKKSHGAVLFIDLDRFKFINDVYGHDAGDKVLKEVARRIKKAVRDEDVVCRFGGDEFIVILSGLGPIRKVAIAEAKRIAKRILSSIDRPVLVNGKEFFLTASIGIAVFSGEITPSEVIKFADVAMYRAKNRGRNRISVFNEELKTRVEWEELVERELKRAVRRREFKLVYQPQFFVGNLKVKKLVGFEALLRILNPKIASIPVSKLIKMAEDCGIIQDITINVIDRVCSLLKFARGKTRIGINVSSQDLMGEDFVEEVEKILRSHGVDPANLCFEVTERVFIEDFDIAKKTVTALRDKGIHIAIDDFGTGYSCLSYLQEFPITEMKVDRTFIENVEMDSKRKSLLSAILKLGKSLNVQPIAEGVEKEEEFRTLKSSGCSLFQGYYFSPPLEENKVLNLMGKGGDIEVSSTSFNGGCSD
ncbi:PAS domain S-box-containing protein/diguanylate cyclase (GGDEF) domain-containing protein [Desulfurobacterium pacificum]|uniref:PAS domain S-box-containing protein/diguanylate cyclase (GGDEF) domain-containing protein n=1 Tax=Desulfurobacterium pacificum TaxID=240166 RepID=A0ABY1NK16_9BACT|nr:EAL domain-containing protein [Desulfurobacterium pacificum]SMP11609.1 PAS domain S-box-containing protein/diguanylate cyclase (GGDEF) domain-containing protein [Desulfurobacterium pacificum]